GECLNRMDDLDAGIRHEDINPPKRLDRMFDAGIDLVLLRHIHADADRRFLARQLLGCRVRGIGIQISDDHPAVCLQIALGDGVTDTAGGAGNEGYFAIKLHNSSSTLNGYATIAVSGLSGRLQVPSGFQSFRRDGIAVCDVLLDGFAGKLVISTYGLALNRFSIDAGDGHGTGLADSLNVARSLPNLLGFLRV